jgi:hypothetical protein
MAGAPLSGKEGALMKPGLFEWRKCGRSWIADIGKLDLEVNERGSVRRGLRWRVRSVLGAQNFGGGWRESVEDAILEAETIAVREALPALRKIVAASSKKRSRP